MSLDIQFAVNENTIIQCDLIEYFSACRDAGFKAVEISYAKLKDSLRFVSVAELKKACNGLEILSLNAYEDIFLVPESNLKALEAETDLIGQLCTLIDCPAVVVPSGRWNVKYGELPPKTKIINLYQKRLMQVKEQFDSFNIKTMFEPINYPDFIIGEPEEINEVLAGNGLKNLTIVPDIHNLHYNGFGSRQLDGIDADIGLFHIDDTPNLPNEQLHVAQTRVFPGDGIADAAGWVKCALDNGYKGYFSLELFDDQIYSMNPDDAAVLCRKKLDLFGDSL